MTGRRSPSRDQLLTPEVDPGQLQYLSDFCLDQYAAAHPSRRGSLPAIIVPLSNSRMQATLQGPASGATSFYIMAALLKISQHVVVNAALQGQA